MHEGNGMDEIAAVHARLGEVEHREILQSAAVAKLSTEIADLRDQVVLLRAELKRGLLTILDAVAK